MLESLGVQGDNAIEVTTTLTESAGEGGAETVPALLWFSCQSADVRLSPVTTLSRVGRDADAHIALEGSALSRLHCEVRKEGPIFTIRDLGSRNGTFVNGAAVEHAVLRDGDVLRVGEWVALFGPCEPHAHEFREIAPGLWGGRGLASKVNEAERAVRAGLSLAIHGPTGTGKELVARAAHHWSGRSGRFCALNCAAVPDGLAESELFGHRKGAFTGADRSALGYFRSADRGTLFLDEVSELPLGMQAKLLRVLQERQVVPVGDQQPVSVDVQVVCAAQTSLRDLASNAEFRLDLATRLSGFTVALPALAARRAEVVPLFRHMLCRFGARRHGVLESKLLECLLLHDWPGNVRELEQVARELQALHGDQHTMRRSHLPAFVQARALGIEATAPRVNEDAKARTRRQRDQERLSDALKETGGNVTRAAKLLQFSRQRAYRLLHGSTTPERAEQLASNEDGD